MSGEREFSVVEFYDSGYHAYVEPRWLDAKGWSNWPSAAPTRRRRPRASSTR